MAGNKVKSQKLKVKTKVSRLHLPQIRRNITAVASKVTEKISWRWVIVLLFVAIVFLQLVQFGQKMYTNYNEAQLQQAQKRTIEAEIAEWQEITRTRPNYRDAYFELAVLTYRLNRIEETKQYLAKVFELDPNFQPARELEKKLQ